MNKKMIVYTVCKLLRLEAFLLLLPLSVSFFYREPLQLKWAYAGTIALIFVVTLIGHKKPDNITIYSKEGFVIVSLSWMLLSLFGSLPFILSGEIPGFIDAFFETASGFTTTGSSILVDLSVISHSNLFWRSFTHFIGGMGVLVLALAIFPDFNTSSIFIMKAEVPGPQFGKLLSKLMHTARTLYIIYVVMTTVLVLFLRLGGMPWFDSFLIAFGTAGTGGFGVQNGSILPYNSPYIEYVLGIAMLLFGINFNLYFMILIRKWKDAVKSEELRAYLSIVAVSVTLIVLNLLPSYDSLRKCIRDAFFAVSTVITTTGFSTADYGSWPAFSQVILLLLMFVGACAGSTAGGLKVSRVVILIKSTFLQLQRMIYPNSVTVLTFEKKRISDATEKSVTNYFTVYMFLFAGFLIINALNAPDFLTSFSSVAATFNNIGPGLGKVGPTYNYAEIGNLSKIALSFAMIIGRLEIFPMLVLFSPMTWRKH
ncbi:MAG: TrkH family potassium uptake protein [Eubacteriaceae bacterium]|jgi:trk system potassium uptake protein TrkH|nr:TrkH family potassium uptake protein [Eubacteriaceae bacterium]